MAPDNFTVCRSAPRSPTGAEKRQLDRLPHNRRKMQDKGLTAIHITAPTHTLPVNTAEDKTKGSDYKTL